MFYFYNKPSPSESISIGGNSISGRLRVSKPLVNESSSPSNGSESMKVPRNTKIYTH